MKDPAVLFYTSDFITGTLTMTHEQRGKYIMLLCLQHQKGHLTEKDMLKICDSYDEDIFEKFEKQGEIYFNKRMKSEAEKRAAYAESRRTNRKKKETTSDNVNIISSSYVPHMENINEDVNVEVKAAKISKFAREQNFRNEVFEKHGEKYPADMLDKFCSYWTESNPNGKKLKFEMQSTFDIAKRLVTWSGNNFGNKRAALQKSDFAKGQSIF